MRSIIELSGERVNLVLSAVIVAVGVLAIFHAHGPASGAGRCSLPYLLRPQSCSEISRDGRAFRRLWDAGGIRFSFISPGLLEDGWVAICRYPHVGSIPDIVRHRGHWHSQPSFKIDLTPVQRDTLTTMINIHRRESRAVKGKEIGELMDRNPETVRIHLRSLKALKLVESVTGPNGGYRATPIAYEALKIDNSSADEVDVPVVRNGIIVDGASTNEIVFNNVMQSARYSHVSIRIIGNIKSLLQWAMISR